METVYAVPDSPAVVPATDLVVLVPETLEPGTEPVAAWTAALAELAERVDGIVEDGVPAGPPTGPAGGALSGSYPNPGLNVVAVRQATTRAIAFATPSATWTTNHTLGRRPIVGLYLSDGEQFDSDVIATDTTVTATHATPVAGHMILS